MCVFVCVCVKGADLVDTDWGLLSAAGMLTVPTSSELQQPTARLEVPESKQKRSPVQKQEPGLKPAKLQQTGSRKSAGKDRELLTYMRKAHVTKGTSWSLQK